MINLSNKYSMVFKFNDKLTEMRNFCVKYETELASKQIEFSSLRKKATETDADYLERKKQMSEQMQMDKDKHLAWLNSLSAQNSGKFIDIKDGGKDPSGEPIGFVDMEGTVITPQKNFYYIQREKNTYYKYTTTWVPITSPKLIEFDRQEGNYLTKIFYEECMNIFWTNTESVVDKSQAEPNNYYITDSKTPIFKIYYALIKKYPKIYRYLDTWQVYYYNSSNTRKSYINFLTYKDIGDM